MKYLYGYVNLLNYKTYITTELEEDLSIENILYEFKNYICKILFIEYNIDVSNNSFIRKFNMNNNPDEKSSIDEITFEVISYCGLNEIQILVKKVSTKSGYFYNKKCITPVYSFFLRNSCFKEMKTHYFPEYEMIEKQEGGSFSESYNENHLVYKSISLNKIKEKQINIEEPIPEDNPFLKELKEVLKKRNLK